MRTTEYYGSRRINYKTRSGLGYTMITIFPADSKHPHEWDRYERNDTTGYCKDYFTGKRIPAAKFAALEKTCHPAF